MVESLALGLWLIAPIFFVTCDQHFTDQWAIRVDGGEEAAKAVATRHGFTYLGKVSALKF